MSKKTSIILALLLLLLGMGVMAYPALSSFVNTLNGSYVIQSLDAQLGQMESQELAAQRSLAQQYNAKISGNILDNADSAFSDYWEILDFGDGLIGYLEVPKIDLRLPVYHGVSEQVLARAVGHMPQTAFPIGGEGNHTVLTGHTGLPSAKLFTDLGKLEAGDRFYIHILGQTLTYQVDQIKIVLPNETQDLCPIQGKDHCTLLTCTPYGVNSHRLLVRGICVEYP